MPTALLLAALLLAHAPSDGYGRALVALELADRAAHARGRGVAQVEAANGRRLDALLMTHGWPARTRWGAAATHAAFVVALHARGLPDRQRAWLAMLERAVAAGEAEPRWAAQLRAQL